MPRACAARGLVAADGSAVGADLLRQVVDRDLPELRQGDGALYAVSATRWLSSSDPLTLSLSLRERGPLCTALVEGSLSRGDQTNTDELSHSLLPPSPPPPYSSSLR